MEMRDYRYQLVRYVADRERMEPINVGIILQGEGRIDLKLSPNAARRKDVDTAAFQQWRRFLSEEIQGDPTPMFQPERTSTAFLRYLEGICEGPIFLSPPLGASVPVESGFNQVIESLYRRLVAPRDADATASDDDRPSGRFRRIAEERKFLDRGMKRQAHLHVGGKRLWMAYRQVRNGELIAFDKVEVDRQLSQTANEIERLPEIARQLPLLLERGDSLRVHYALLADELVRPFRDQTEEEFLAMREDLRRYTEAIVKAGGTILESRADVDNLADEIDRKLPRLAVAT